MTKKKAGKVAFQYYRMLYEKVLNHTQTGDKDRRAEQMAKDLGWAMKDILHAIKAIQANQPDALSEKIAYEYLKWELSAQGVSINHNTRRQYGNYAKSMGVSTGEALGCVSMVVRELLAEYWS